MRTQAVATAPVTHTLQEHYTCQEVYQLATAATKIALSEAQVSRVEQCRAYLESKIEGGNRIHYGINTGFGDNANIAISPEHLEALQLNLVRSHAVGMGDEVPAEIVRIMLLLKVISLCGGYSGIRTAVVEQLSETFNANISPIVYQYGSLGASGDLAPLAHISLVLMGEGEARDANGNLLSGNQALALAGLKPLRLQSKEGLALLNGTQFMSAYGVWLITHAFRIFDWAQALAALSCEAFLASNDPFHPAIHKARPHRGQMLAAEQILSLRAGSQLAGTSGRVQDPYSFRCIPQVHGASWDTFKHVESVLETEVNATTDNPNVFPDEDRILSGGNFHGQPLALVLDFLAIALAELGNISERRTYLLMAGKNDTKVFLADNPGLESGLMIAQYLAAGLVSANKQLCTPASVDSIPSSNGQEDHVSMGANAATKCYRVVENLYRILAVEWMSAYAALNPARRQRLSPTLAPLCDMAEGPLAIGHGDRFLSPELQRLENYLRNNACPLG